MKRVLIDTNVLVSALVFPAGVAAQAFRLVVADQRLALNTEGATWPPRVATAARRPVRETG